MSTFGLCPFCGKTKPSANGTGSDVACCGEIGHTTVIHTDHPLYWTAVTGDYDGAPDSRSPVGLGNTEQAALDDLLEKLEA